MGTNDRQLADELRTFIEHHSEGWNHDEWVELLHHLADAGFDTSDPSGIGTMLERERLSAQLEEAAIAGLGPKRREALAERFNTMWNLRHATAEEIQAVPTIPKALAERLEAALR